MEDSESRRINVFLTQIVSYIPYWVNTTKIYTIPDIDTLIPKAEHLWGLKKSQEVLE